MQSQVFLRKTNYKGLVKKNGALQSAGSKGSTIIRDRTVKEENTGNIIRPPDATDILKDTFYLFEKSEENKKRFAA